MSLYAVVVGRKTGLLSSWKECEESVKGYPGALHKKFKDNQRKQAEAYIANHSNISEEVGYIAYTDGSYSNGVYGSGCVIITPEQEVFELSYAGNDPRFLDYHQMAGETFAAVLAMQWAAEKNVQINIRHDYSGISEWILGGFEAGSFIAKMYIKLYNHLRGDRKEFVSFTKVKAHSGDKWNNLADSLARKARENYIVKE